MNNPSDNQNENDKKAGGTIANATNGLNQSGRLENQNQNHNTKKVAQGPNTKR
jgi:hypothetical protein